MGGGSRTRTVIARGALDRKCRTRTVEPHAPPSVAIAPLETAGAVVEAHSPPSVAGHPELDNVEAGAKRHDAEPAPELADVETALERELVAMNGGRNVVGRPTPCDNASAPSNICFGAVHGWHVEHVV